MKRVFERHGLCKRCQHDHAVHHASMGADGVRRLFCGVCPLTTIRMMGDEGTEYPIPFFIEGPLGPPEPCFEGRTVRRKLQNVHLLPRSPGPHGAFHFTLQAMDDDGAQFSGTAWRVDEIERLKPGDDVRRNLVYKHQLYWDQEGLCRECPARMRFDNSEMDRLVPGSAGGGYTVGNVQLLCPSCNRTRQDRDMEYLRRRRREQGLLP